MARTSLTAAKDELYGLLSSSDVPSISGVDAVYDHLPPYTTLSGSVSVAVFTAGVTADFWLLAVRVFAGFGVDAKSTQDALDLILPLIDDATNTGGYGPAAWEFEFPTREPQFITATCVYQVGREDI